MKEELIKTVKLCRSFESESGTQEILKEINLSIYKGDFTVIMGSSGSGKSTLLYSLFGMDNITSGNIFYGDTDITTLSTDKMAKFRRDHCGFIFQQICLVDSISVLDNILAAGLLQKRDRKQLLQEAKDLLKKVEVEGDKITLIKTTPPEVKEKISLEEKVRRLDKKQKAKLASIIDHL